MENSDRDVSGPIISRTAASSFSAKENCRPPLVGFRLLSW